MQYKCDIIHLGVKWHEPTHSYDIKKEFGIYKGMDIVDNFYGHNHGIGPKCLRLLSILVNPFECMISYVAAYGLIYLIVNI